jgi:aspartate aminotransferase-like enzyme
MASIVGPMPQKAEVFLDRDMAVLAFGKTAGSGATAAGSQHGLAPKNPISFLPGPVHVRRTVRDALAGNPISHRSGEFKSELAFTKRLLCRLVNGTHVEILLGSGTLSNDVIAGQLSLESGPGLVLSNGEFGARLVDHVRRFRLRFDVVEREWGEAFQVQELAARLNRFPPYGWLLATACETSTGVLNDIGLLKRLCAERGTRLCLDCVSAVGNVALDLQGVYLASAVSGKGLGSVPGLCMVFYDHAVRPQPGLLPRYLDLGFYAGEGGTPFTQSSNLLAALRSALEAFSAPQRFEEKLDLSRWLRRRLRHAGFRILASDDCACPAVVTVVLPDSLSAERVGDRLRECGLLVSYQSGYLLRRNWIQICLMGDCSKDSLALLLGELERLAGKPLPAE